MATRLKSLAIRLALPIAMIGATAVGVVSPAHAEPLAAEPPKVELTVPDKVVTADGRSKTVPIEVVNAGETAVTGLVVEFTATVPPIDPRIGFQPPAGCTAAAGCTVGDLAPGASKAYTFTVQPTADLPEAGVSFTVSVRDAGATWKKSATVTVEREKQGIDLEVADIPDIKLAPGKSAVLPISVRNNGNTTTKGVAIALAAQRYVNFPNNYANCVDVKDLPGIVCVFDLVLTPGSSFGIEPAHPLTVAVDRTAPGPADYTAGMYAFGLDDKVNAESLAAAAEAAKKPGTKLQLVPAAEKRAAAQRSIADDSELNEWDNSISFLVKVPLPQADSAALGDDFEGKIGAISTIKIGFRNNGPGAVLPRTPKWIHSAKVRIPSGLRLTKVDKRCVPNGDGQPRWSQPGRVNGHEYLCVASKPLAPAAQELFAFTGKIINGENEGTITVVGGVQDGHRANNVAEIDVKVTQPIATATPTPIAVSGGAGGGLAITGAPTGRIAATGLLFVFTGALALLLTRRRRPA